MPRPDPANFASKLPASAQWPVGAALGGLQSILGGDDPAGQTMGAAMPMTSIAGGLGQGMTRLGQAGSEALQGLRGYASRGMGGIRGMLRGGATEAPQALQGLSQAEPRMVRTGSMGDLDTYQVHGGPHHGFDYTSPAGGPPPNMPSAETGVDALDAHQNQTYQGIMNQAWAGKQPNMANASVRDVMKPRSIQTMDQMFEENNPIFKEMQAKGMFNRGQ